MIVLYVPQSKTAPTKTTENFQKSALYSLSCVVLESRKKIIIIYICLKIQQHSFNPMSDHLALADSSPNTGSSAVYQQKSFFINKTGKNIFEKVSKSVCPSTILVLPDPLPPAPSTSSATNPPEHTEVDPDDP
jgi:hypothetical protein